MRARVLPAEWLAVWCRVVLRTKTRAEGGIGNYLAEAAAATFKPTKSDVPWQGTASPFSGRITHHDGVARLRRVYELVQEAKQAVQGPPAPRHAHAPLSPVRAGAQQHGRCCRSR